ncbi:hypothetical protein Q1695_005531 [Nippostrongylus brasiliensis]|nr:hypothetical protein Q1695_005531 [Nippostrongylus brasiliensis]
MNPTNLLWCFLLLVECAEIARCLSANAKESLQRAYKGVDLERQRQRLRNLGGAVLGNNGTAAESAVPALPVEATNEIIPSNTEDADIPDINVREGVAEYLFNGDIILSEKQMAAIERNSAKENSMRKKRQASLFSDKWLNNKVYFYFDVTLADTVKALVRKAHKYISSRTCIDFIENATATNRVHVFPGAGCYSSLGMTGGEQDLSLGSNCHDIGIAAHEFMHALGFRHMHTRSDRDQFLKVDLTYVKPDYVGQFLKADAGETVNYTPYEYGSVMHYAASVFTTQGYALTPVERRYITSLGTRVISFLDIKMINDHYKCSAKCGANAAKCANGGMPNPRNCATCLCTSGYGGSLCETRPAGCGETLTATSAWKTKTFSFGDSTNTALRDDYTRCHHWVKAPAGKRPQIRVTKFTKVNCAPGCRQNSMEPRIFANKRVTNPRMCCSWHLNQVWTSELNIMPIISYNRISVATFTFQYRFV